MRKNYCYCPRVGEKKEEKKKKKVRLIVIYGLGDGWTLPNIILWPSRDGSLHIHELVLYSGYSSKFLLYIGNIDIYERGRKSRLYVCVISSCINGRITSHMVLAKASIIIIITSMVKGILRIILYGKLALHIRASLVMILRWNDIKSLLSLVASLLLEYPFQKPAIVINHICARSYWQELLRGKQLESY